LKPFVEAPESGVFSLYKSANARTMKSSLDLQPFPASL